ncbi:MAG: hypothetical protein WA001_04735 [Patescibacteria group bacterium]
MSKHKSRPVALPKKDDNTIHIDKRAVERKVRKPLPPAIQWHRQKTGYTRKPKHPGSEDA